jgi:hypothetical protein
MDRRLKNQKTVGVMALSFLRQEAVVGAMKHREVAKSNLVRPDQQTDQHRKNQRMVEVMVLSFLGGQTDLVAEHLKMVVGSYLVEKVRQMDRRLQKSQKKVVV